ncbi:MAG: YncE family protein [Acidobacteriota bacterium]
MSRRIVSLFAAVFVGLCAVSILHAQSAPLTPVQKDAMPPSVQGKFDHLAIDLRGHRLFAAAEGAHQVLVFDLETGRYLRSIDGIPIPHAILVRPDIDRIFITDGGDGAVRIYDGSTYRLLKTVPLKVDTDSIAYDPRTRYLYVDNGGGDAHESYSILSVIDTTEGTKVADIRIDGDTLEAMALERGSERMFVNDASENKVVVLNRKTRQVVAVWPVTLGKRNVAMALDEAHHRLFVACRNGKLVTFDTQSGKELQALPIGGGVDDAAFDPATQRLYVQCGTDGSTWIYQELGSNQLTQVGRVAEGANAKNSLLAQELNRYYVIVPPASGRGFIDAFSIAR